MNRTARRSREEVLQDMLPDRYEIKEIIHATEISRVCVVERDGQEFVAKLPPLGNEHAEKRFAREILALQRAAGLNTIPLIDFDDSLSWYVMPRAVGNLASFPAPFTVDAAIAVLEAITSSLAALHAAGEVHRDLKPGNILWLHDAQGGRWVVADFGIVRNPAGLTTTGLTRTGRFLGTDGWAAPEQSVDAHAVTPTADVYAAGLIAAWMLTGVHPSAGAVDHLVGTPLSSAISRAVSEKPHRRHASMDAFMEACRAELVQTKPSLASLIAQGAFNEITSVGIAQPGVRDAQLDALAALTPQERDRWFSAEREGLTDVLTKAIDGLVDDVNMISFSATVDPILKHGVEVLHKLALSQLPGTRQFAVTVFGGIADIHQFAPASLALDRIDALPIQAQETIRAALHEAGAWDFFAQMASDRFPSRRRTPLLIELAGQ